MEIVEISLLLCDKLCWRPSYRWNLLSPHSKQANRNSPLPVGNSKKLLIGARGDTLTLYAASGKTTMPVRSQEKAFCVALCSSATEEILSRSDTTAHAVAATKTPIGWAVFWSTENDSYWIFWRRMSWTSSAIELNVQQSSPLFLNHFTDWTSFKSMKLITCFKTPYRAPLWRLLCCLIAFLIHFIRLLSPKEGWKEDWPTH